MSNSRRRHRFSTGRRFLAVSALAAALVLAGCSGSDTNAPPPHSSIESSRHNVQEPTSGFGEINDVRAVGSASDHPAHGLDRDAGISVQLRDGSVVWFFGDTGRVRPDWSLEFFVIGTAAWAPAESPTQTSDFLYTPERSSSAATPPIPRPVPFATADPAAMRCPMESPNPGMWPYGAVVVPDGEVDRVIVWMENVCLGSSTAVESRGMSVGEWRYTPGVEYRDQPIRVTMLNDRLWEGRGYGYAAAMYDGWVYTYVCVDLAAARLPAQMGEQIGCRVARVHPDDVADPLAYEAFDGTRWSKGAEPTVMDMAPSDEEFAAERAVPPGGLSVAFNQHVNRFVMLYSPWPGHSEEIRIRLADAPQGPWGEAISVPLPGCRTVSSDMVFGCYAGALQTFLDGPDSLGVGWYDRIVVDGGSTGAYQVGRLQVDVEAFSASR